jgi:hypothetical protein
MALAFNFYEQIIDVLEPQTEVVIQDLLNQIRDQEYSVLGVAFDKIADATGKDDLGGGVVTGITLTLMPNWQLRFWEGEYVASITGGNLVGGKDGNPLAFTAGVQVRLVQSAASTLVTGGSALTSEEHEKLMSGLEVTIPSAVWEEILASHTTSGSAGKMLKDAKSKATLASLKN